MNDLRKAAEMALEALCVAANDVVPNDINKQLEQAAEALRKALAHEALDEMVAENQRLGLYDDAVNMSQERVDETAKGEHEPVAYLDEGLGAFYWPNDYEKDVGFTPLYAVPPHRWSNVTDEDLMQEVRRRGFVIRDAQIDREWVGLTDEESKPLIQKAMMYYGHNPDHWTLTAGAGFCIFARAIEAKLRKKNT